MKSILKATALVATGALGMLAALYAIVTIKEYGYVGKYQMNRCGYDE